MAITFFAEVVTPTDNGAQAGPGPQAITPPGSMLAGDLVVVFAQYQSLTGAPEWRVDTTGGQAWSGYRQGIFVTPALSPNRPFFCRFNGTWAANPAFRTDAGALALTLTMLVFRPSDPSKFWTSDNIGGIPGEKATATTQTITGRTTVQPSTVTIAFWLSPTAVTWGTLSGSGWSKTGLSAQYRNTTDTDMSGSAAYNIRTTAGAVADVSQTQSTSQVTATWLMTLAEIDLPTGSGGAGSPTPPVQIADVFNDPPINPQPLAFGSAVGVGHAVIGGVSHESNANVVSILDNQGNEYTVIQVIYDIHFDHCTVLFFRPGITNGPTTVTVTFSEVPAFSTGMMLHEVAGITGLDKHQGIEYRAPAGGAQTITIEAVTTTANGEYVFAYAFNVGAFVAHPNYDMTAWGTKRREGDGVGGGFDYVTGDAVQGVAGAFTVTIGLADATNHEAVMATFFVAAGAVPAFAGGRPIYKVAPQRWG